ncbi:integrase family protein [Massilia sp. LC238]|uniref:gamma-mobile-trio integrase GmtZ n=1 Tax=Massilia sp. LC238 TaxID=1502852 RepID=UPI0004E30C8C|nr:integrase family protein [Massilia sp. LC238]KFC73037.1 hypothetical protein FG94_01716 [Massilia sp. LC238]
MKSPPSSDITLAWMEQRHPDLTAWRDYAVRWLAKSNKDVIFKLKHLRVFFEEYLARLNLPTSPEMFLRKGQVWPDFSASIMHVKITDKRRIVCNDHIADFLSWIIAEDFSDLEDTGHKVPLPSFANPVRRIQKVADRTIDDPSLRPHVDKSLRWVVKLYPELAAWRLLAIDWLAGQTGPSKPKLIALQSFFREFIIGEGLPTVPEQFFEVTSRIPDFYEVCLARRSEFYARPWTTHMHNFSNWVLNKRLSIVGPDGVRTIPKNYHNPILKRTVKTVAKHFDTTLSWVTESRPDLEEWRSFAAEWLAQETRGIDSRLKALVLFFDRYLIGQNLPATPSYLFSRKSLVPDFYVTCCAKDKEGGENTGEKAANNNNRIHDFLDWLLKTHFSCDDDDGIPVVSPAYRNPVPYRSHSGGSTNRESVYSPLPFGFIEDMRLMLAQGPTFSDWTWAHNALGRQAATNGRDASDWFSVNEKDIDKNDPDCVWRIRRYEAGHSEYQMWSPIRWVALLFKLQLPFRVFQVRMLDSGEADTWRYADGKWLENKHELAQGTKRRPLAQGLFRRVDHLKDVKQQAILYVNTNKSADQKKSGPAKGYEVPWPNNGPIHQNPFYWAERLRNWQEKYNPIKRRTSWTELKANHIQLKGPAQLATYPDTCFLFRLREVPLDERHLPMGITAMNRPWYELLLALQERLDKTGQYDSGGMPFAFVPPYEESNGGVTVYFPLQSLRVSLITALALDGMVPFSILQKLVGHSRLLMTLYYTKLGPTFVGTELAAAAARMEENSAGSIKRFVADAKHDELMKKVAYNSAPSIKSVIAEDPGARNPAGWMLLHHGMCMVGGNTAEVEENKKVGGCHNGGPNVGTELQPKWAPVPGGSRNCPRCRWFATQPQYLPSLVATFNNHAYHFDEARNSCMAAEERLQEMRRLKFEVEASGQPFQQMADFLEHERVYEGAMKKFSDLAETLVATWRLIERCTTLLKEGLANGNQLVAVGDVNDVAVAFEETESELLQLSGVCEGVEVYPDLDAGKAVFRRSQLLDLALCREGSVPVFMTMSEADQLACGNAFMRQLANQVSPNNVQLGMRRVVELMDSGEQLGQMLGIDVAKLVPSLVAQSRKVIPIRPVPAAQPNSKKAV